MKKIENCKKYLQIFHKISTYIYLNYERREEKKYVYKICTHRYQFLIKKIIYDGIASDNLLAVTYCT